MCACVRLCVCAFVRVCVCVRAQAKSCMIELLLDNCTREQRERDAQTQIDCAEIGTIGAQRIGHVVSEVRRPSFPFRRCSLPFPSSFLSSFIPCMLPSFRLPPFFPSYLPCLLSCFLVPPFLFSFLNPHNPFLPKHLDSMLLQRCCRHRQTPARALLILTPYAWDAPPSLSLQVWEEGALVRTHAAKVAKAAEQRREAEKLKRQATANRKKAVAAVARGAVETPPTDVRLGEYACGTARSAGLVRTRHECPHAWA
eukprot:COSAG05_NODE_807_length_7192_cov_92.394191_7_plen_255_part_00